MIYSPIIERYSHVMHIGSTVRGEIKNGFDALDAACAVLPAGTLSGAPKIRACQLIGELENNKRGIYGGAISAYHPYAVDASSSLETNGVKDKVKMTAFVNAIRNKL